VARLFQADRTAGVGIVDTARLYLSVLGGFEARLRRPDRPVLLQTRRAEALLAYLALVPRRHGREFLVSLLWSDAPGRQGRQSLRQTLSSVRTALGRHHPFLVTTRDSVLLDPRLVRTDAGLLRNLLRRNTPFSAAAASRLYGGDLLQGIHIPTLEFESWLAFERASLRQTAIRACESHLANLIATQRTPEAVQVALRLLTMDPLQEHVHRTLMELYRLRGQIGAALRQYETCARLFALELGLEPDEETQKLRRDLLRSHGRKVEGTTLAASPAEPDVSRRKNMQRE
jgi:DNA-binding SARP family transcriptional activator